MHSLLQRPTQPPLNITFISILSATLFHHFSHYKLTHESHFFWWQNLVTWVSKSSFPRFILRHARPWSHPRRKSNSIIHSLPPKAAWFHESHLNSRGGITGDSHSRQTSLLYGAKSWLFGKYCIYKRRNTKYAHDPASLYWTEYIRSPPFACRKECLGSPIPLRMTRHQNL